MTLFHRWPCARGPRPQREALAPLVDAPDGADAALVAHVAGCASCTTALGELRELRAALGALGDAPGAAADDRALRRVLAAVAADRRAARSWGWLALGAAAAVAVLSIAGVRRVTLTRARQAEDRAILVRADEAFRRAEQEYGDAIALLRLRLEARRPDDRVLAGARVLAAAKAQAAALVRERAGDAEREALLRDALRAEVRYYEDALLRAGDAP